LNLLIKKSIVFLLALAACTGKYAFGQRDIVSKNQAHRYSPGGEFFFDYQASQPVDSDSLTITCKLVLNEEKASIEDYNFSFFSTDSYSASADNELAVDSAYIGSRGNSHFISFSMPTIKDTELLVMEVLSRVSGVRYYFDILAVEIMPITVTDQSGVPVVHDWVRPGEFGTRSDRQSYGLFYSLNFDPALPPMVTRDPKPSRQMTMDSLFVIQPSEPFILNKEGLYLFQYDTTLSTGTPVTVVDKYYPKPSRLDQLVDPLIYITTRDEWNRLSVKGIEKKDFDKFWLDLTRSAQRAKRIIKIYYDRVEEANQFFTTYKRGWKTDKGLIYIVFGTPDRVTKTQDKEKWSYFARQNAAPVEFEFIRVNSIFSTEHYVLIREKKFANSWFKAIDMLRKGRF